MKYMIAFVTCNQVFILTEVLLSPPGWDASPSQECHSPLLTQASLRIYTKVSIGEIQFKN